jgi:hypothetical protein
MLQPWLSWHGWLAAICEVPIVDAIAMRHGEAPIKLQPIPVA